MSTLLFFFEGGRVRWEILDRFFPLIPQTPMKYNLLSFNPSDFKEVQPSFLQTLKFQGSTTISPPKPPTSRIYNILSPNPSDFKEAQTYLLQTLRLQKTTPSSPPNPKIPRKYKLLSSKPLDSKELHPPLL